MEIFKRKGVVLWDLDSTLVDTSPVFNQGIDQVVDFFRACAPIDESFKDRLNFHQLNVRRTEHVNPHTIWPLTLASLREEYSLTSDQCDQAVEIMMNVYTVLPIMYPGIREALTALKDMNFEQSVVTHAEPKWTDFKIDGHNLRQFFTEMVIVDVTGPKSSSDWHRAMVSHVPTSTDQFWAIGDNILADVKAALDAGIPNVIHADFSPGGPLTRNGNLPEEAHVAKQPSEIPLIIKQYSK